MEVEFRAPRDVMENSISAAQKSKSESGNSDSVSKNVDLRDPEAHCPLNLGCGPAGKAVGANSDSSPPEPNGDCYFVVASSGLAAGLSEAPATITESGSVRVRNPEVIHLVVSHKKTGQICWREKSSVSDLGLSSLAGFFAFIWSNLCTRHIPEKLTPRGHHDWPDKRALLTFAGLAMSYPSRRRCAY